MDDPLYVTLEKQPGHKYERRLTLNGRYYIYDRPYHWDKEKKRVVLDKATLLGAEVPEDPTKIELIGKRKQEALQQGIKSEPLNPVSTAATSNGSTARTARRTKTAKVTATNNAKAAHSLTVSVASATPAYYIGLMSGTSIDGLDGVLIAIDSYNPLRFHTLTTASLPWEPEIKDTLHQLCLKNSSVDHTEELYAAANAVAQHEAKLCLQLCQQAALAPSFITAIGAHGQTVRHCPQQGFSVQIDNGPLLANLTGIDAVVNFRAADIALGGQGAPLTQLFHQQILAQEGQSCFVLNLGGIANVTALGRNRELLTAFDTGPANTLLDYVCRTYLECMYDLDGGYAQKGQIDTALLQRLLSHPYLQRDFPKSTGREDFNAELLQREVPLTPKQHLTLEQACTLLCTLTEYTVITVLDGIAAIKARYPQSISEHSDLILCGGGAENTFLRERMAQVAAERGLGLQVRTCTDFGVNTQFLEAQAFAYFAALTVQGQTFTGLCHSTGARADTILGCICPAPQGHYACLLNKLRTC